jgi:hypothetical protein
MTNAKSHTVQIKLQRSYSRESDEHAFSVVRLKNEHIKKFGGSGKWVKISNYTNKSIYRRIKGAGATDLPANGLELDYEAFRELGCWSSESPINGFYPTALRIKKASFYEGLLAHVKHPDPAYSTPMILGYISLALGILSILLSIL